jgi:hypothetical protein
MTGDPRSCLCSNRVMDVRRPAWWWCYPLACANGHKWEPGLIIVSWTLCDCGPARAAQERAGGPAGHMAVFCNAARGCRSVWYRPRCERDTALKCDEFSGGTRPALMAYEHGREARHRRRLLSALLD